MKKPALIALIFSLLVSYNSAAASQRADQSQETVSALFEQANQALNAKNYAQFDQKIHRLADHPLTTYLTYRRLSKDIARVDSKRIEDFIKQNPQLKITQLLKSQWLDLLANQKQWTSFRKYTDTQLLERETELQCYDLKRQIEQKGTLSRTASQTAQQLWRENKSLPLACDSMSLYLKNKQLITPEMVWDKVYEALSARHYKTADKLAKTYFSKKNQGLYTQWKTWIKNPKKYLKSKNKPWVNPLGNRFTALGLEHLMRQDLDLAIAEAEYFKARMKQSPELVESFEHSLAKRAYIKDHPKAIALLAALKKDDEERLGYLLKASLKLKNWSQANLAAAKLQNIDNQNEEYLYWRARSLEALGHTQLAQNLYSQLAKERDYYGFLAADKLNLPYQFNDLPIQLEARQNWATFAKQYPALPLIKELIEVDYSRTARIEWMHLLNQVDEESQKRLGRLANQQGWNDLAIIALGKAKYWDDLEVRYPLAHRDVVENQAQAAEINQAWIYGIMRQESVFQEDARSSVGALGLMQLMPNTAKYVAKELNLKRPSQDELLKAPTNIQLGSHYLKNVLTKFGGNQALATAAYNAGPTRVAEWLPAKEEDADIWIETIPFGETRKYVKSVLENQVVFEWRMHGKYTRLSERLPFVSQQANLQELKLP
jgi:soluble lytic murein transglycosylase